MKLSINPTILNDFSELNLGIVVCKGIENHGKNTEILKMLEAQEKEVSAKFSGIEISSYPKIKAWRDAYSKFGGKAKKHNPSVEALVRRCVEGKYLPHINNLVNLYNFISLKYLVPVGSDNLDKVDGNIQLTKALGNEIYIAIDEEEVANPNQGEVIYRDDKEVLCRRWNWKECKKTMLTEDIKNAVLYVEALPPTTKEELQRVLNELKELVEKYCSAKCETKILNKGNPQVDL